MPSNALLSAMEEWLRELIQSQLSQKYELVSVLSPRTSLNRVIEDWASSMTNISTWEFRPDIVAVLRERSSGKTELLFVNAKQSSISLKDIGEMHLYAKLANPVMAMLISPKGISNEVNLLMLESEIRNQCLQYASDRSITLCGWNEAKNQVDVSTVLPLNHRKIITLS